MELNWFDFNIGLIVHTPKGRGSVCVLNKIDNKVSVNIDDIGLEEFNMSEISIGMGQLPPKLTALIGQYILLFQRLENRMKDFMNYCFDLNKHQRANLTSDFTAGKLLNKLNIIFKNHSNEQALADWKKINAKIDHFIKVRNSIIHGYLFHFNESHELDYASLHRKF